MLARTFGCVRVVFNDAIRCREAARRAGEKISPTDVQRRVITEAKTTDERAWLREVASVALVQSVRDADRAYRNFFDSLAKRRRGRRMGRPRLKSRKDSRQTFRLTRNGFVLRAGGQLYLAKIGDVRVRWSRLLPSDPSSLTIILEPDGHYYVSFVVDVDPAPLPQIDREAGVDLGISRLAVVADTDGQCLTIANPRHLARKLRGLARLEREKHRRAKGGANREKTRRKLAAQHAKITRARRDHHHKQALILIRENQAIYVEHLNIVGMVANRRLRPGPSSTPDGHSSSGSCKKRPSGMAEQCRQCPVGCPARRPVQAAVTSWTPCRWKSDRGPALNAERRTIVTAMRRSTSSPPGGRRSEMPVEPR